MKKVMILCVVLFVTIMSSCKEDAWSHFVADNPEFVESYAAARSKYEATQEFKNILMENDRARLCENQNGSEHLECECADRLRIAQERASLLIEFQEYQRLEQDFLLQFAPYVFKYAPYVSLNDQRKT